MMKRSYGVRITLPEHDSLARPHLLGANFSAEHWFPTKEARKNYLNRYQTPFLYYRKGDTPNLNYELIEK